jgi:hypothetical protein
MRVRCSSRTFADAGPRFWDSKTKIALIAAIAGVGVASSAFAQDAAPLVQYQRPSERPGFGAQTVPKNDRVTVRGGRLYNSVVPSNEAAVVPSHDWEYYSENSAATRGGMR